MSKLKDIQKKELLMLDAFIAFCNEHQLRWFADGGTLLGAVRHEGFIPWDDDVDVCMPREDYQLFVEYMKERNYRLADDIFFQNTDSDPEYFNIVSRLRLDNTTAISEREVFLNSHKGIFIDIYPIDHMSEDEDEMQYLIGFLRGIRKATDVETDATAYRTCNAKLMYDAMTQMLIYIDFENEFSKYVAPLVFCAYSKYKNIKISTNAYSDYELCKFKGLKHKIRIPVGYDEILTLWYGKDYMTPRKETAFHSCFIDPYHDYHEYDGIDYEDLIKQNVNLKKRSI